MKLYQVTVQYSRTNAQGWRESMGLPTFYLRDDMQGIVDEAGAERVARHMCEALAPTATTFSISISVSKDFDPAVIGA